ncbi:hypothetical protein ACKKBG_A07365 [Auxenochlorella protothecoides x Auxenochlorella symbiontica]
MVLKTFFIGLDGHKYIVGDSILVHPPAGNQPYVAKIEQISSRKANGSSVVTISWYYRPEEAHGGRKSYHGRDELFPSDHYDDINVQSVEGPCRVLTRGEYTEATEQVANGLKEDDGIPCFYTCVEYKAAKRAFHPDRIDVYCCCNMPYNPDLDMIQCTCCEDFFHAACIGATNEELPYLSNLGFVCMECAMAKEAAGALPGTYRK